MAFLVADLTKNSKIQFSHVRVPMTKEPIEFFTHIFANYGVVIHKGDYTSLDGLKKRLSTNTSLYQIHGTHLYNTMAIQIDENSKNLNSGDPFILHSTNDVYLWCGIGARNEEISLGEKNAVQFLNDRKFTKITEGTESEEFWGLLGNY